MTRHSPDGWDEDWPGAATHHLAKPVTCPVCGKPSATMVQSLDGTKIGDPVCSACYVEGLPTRRRRGEAAS